jgi:hypothetical protein
MDTTLEAAKNQVLATAVLYMVFESAVNYIAQKIRILPQGLWA